MGGQSPGRGNIHEWMSIVGEMEQGLKTLHHRDLHTVASSSKLFFGFHPCLCRFCQITSRKPKCTDAHQYTSKLCNELFYF